MSGNQAVLFGAGGPIVGTGSLNITLPPIDTSQYRWVSLHAHVDGMFGGDGTNLNIDLQVSDDGINFVGDPGAVNFTMMTMVTAGPYVNNQIITLNYPRNYMRLIISVLAGGGMTTPCGADLHIIAKFYTE